MSIPEGHRVIARVAWDSVKELMVYLRRGGVHPVANTQPRYIDRVSRHGQWYKEPETPTTPLSVPEDEVECASRLFREWQAEKNAQIRPLQARIRGGLLLGALGMVGFWAVLWWLLKDAELAATYTIVAGVLVLFVKIHWR